MDVGSIGIGGERLWIDICLGVMPRRFSRVQDVRPSQIQADRDKTLVRTAEVQVPEIPAVFEAAGGMQRLKSPAGNTSYRSQAISAATIASD
jgi:hypothetical protein